METSFLSRLAEKTITKEQLYREVESNWSLLPKLINGVSSTKASIRYGCGKVLMDLSEKYPDRLHPFMEVFVQLLDGTQLGLDVLDFPGRLLPLFLEESVARKELLNPRIVVF